jgi:hypothetical protein
MLYMLKRYFLLYVLILLPVNELISYPQLWHVSGKAGLDLSKNFNTLKKQKQISDVLLIAYLSRNSYVKGGVSLWKVKINRPVNVKNVKTLGLLSYNHTFCDFFERLFLNGALGISFGKRALNIILGAETEFVMFAYCTMNLRLSSHIPIWKGKNKFMPFWAFSIGINFTI